MVTKKRKIKEEAIIDAAERVFFKQGVQQAKMDDVAREVGMSKASLYFYFSSRDELYLAITLRALELLVDTYYKAIADHQHESAFVRVMATFEAYLKFSEEHFHYHEALFNYMSMIRHSSLGGTPLPDESIKNSVYYLKLQDMHNLPLDIVVKHIDEGKKEGSITNQAPSKMIYLTSWALIAGFIKLNIYGGKDRASIYRVNLSQWKAHIIKMSELMLKGE